MLKDIIRTKNTMFQIFRRMDIVTRVTEFVEKYGLVPFLVMGGSLQALYTIARPFVKEPEVGVVKHVYVHPVRALPPVKVDVWPVSIEDGFMSDKRLCILESSGARLKHKSSNSANLYKVKVRLQTNNPQSKIILSYPGKSDLILDPKSFDKPSAKIEVHDGKYKYVGDKPSEWLSDIVGRNVRLMFCPYKLANGANNTPPGKDLVHVLGEATLDEFSAFSGKKISADRFRPNVISVDHGAFEELRKWKHIRIGDVELSIEHGTERCLITCMSLGGFFDPEIFEKLKKWAPRDAKSNKPLMGSYYEVLKPGEIKVGDSIVLLN